MGAPLTIRDLRVRAVTLPMGRPLATRVGAFTDWSFLLIDLETEEGVTGHSYLNAPLARRPLAALLAELGERLKGDPVAPQVNYAKAHGGGGLLGYQGLTTMAVSALDMALWDAQAQAADLPLARLLGGTLGSVKAYNSNGLGLMPPDQVADEALALVAQGNFSAIKLRLGRERAADDYAAARNVREAVGGEMIVFSDFNQGLKFGEALERCRALDSEGLGWFEEPLAYDDFAGHARLARELATPIQIGENLYGPHAMHDALQAGACDYVMPDLGRIGGVTGWLRAAALADGARVQMSSHLYPEASAHLMRVTPTAHWLEWTDWANPILAAPFTLADGQLEIPDRPGTGVAWDEDAVARYGVDL